jgi:hypothetical protein
VKTAGVSLKTVSVVLASLRCLSFQAGKRDFQCCRSLSETFTLANGVVTEIARLIVSYGAHAKKGLKSS